MFGFNCLKILTSPEKPKLLDTGVINSNSLPGLRGSTPANIFADSEIPGSLSARISASM